MCYSQLLHQHVQLPERLMMCVVVLLYLGLLWVEMLPEGPLAAAAAAPLLCRLYLHPLPSADAASLRMQVFSKNRASDVMNSE
jgi:hypothetical protein